MKRILILFFPGCLILTSLALTASASVSYADDWRPVTPEELQLKADQISKDADAAVLFSETHIDNSEAESVAFSEYIRIKVFTDRGIEQAANRSIPFGRRERIKDVKARTIKPDGSITELKKEDVHEKTLVKISSGEVREKTFTMPGVTQGSIIEYRYHRYVDRAYAFRIDLQQEFYTREVTVYVKPFNFPGYLMHWMLVNSESKEKIDPVKERDWHVIRAHNIPGLKEEPYMPPSRSRRMWGLLWYTQNEGTNFDKYWANFGQSEDSKWERDFVSKNKEVKKVVASLVAPNDDPVTKAKKLSDYIQHQIHNISVAQDEEIDIRKFREIQGADDVLKTKLGEPDWINLLYVAMLQAAGLDAHIVRLTNRATDVFRKNLTEDFQFTDDLAAVKGADGKYTFYDPGTALSPFGYISWEKQWVPALIVDKKNSVFVDLPMSDSSVNMTARSAELTIQPDGVAFGKGSVQYTGGESVSLKSDLYSKSADYQATHWREHFAKNSPNFTSKDEKIENVSDPDKPLTAQFDVRIEGYASKTGKRLLLQPCVFTRGQKSLFSASNRVQDVSFTFPWAEKDHIVFKLPEGYTIEELPEGILLDAKAAKYKLTFKVQGDKLIVDRDLNVNFVFMPVSAYGALKQFFDEVYKGDQYTISLKQGAN